MKKRQRIAAGIGALTRRQWVTIAMCLALVAYFAVFYVVLPLTIHVTK